MNDADKFVALALIRQIDLQRVATWIVQEALIDLAKLEKDIADAILRIDPAGSLQLRTRNSRLRSLQNEVHDLIDSVMEELGRRHKEHFDEVIAAQVEDERANFLAVYGLTLVGSAMANSETLLIGGATLDMHYAKVGADLEFRIMATVRDAVTAGAGAEAIYNEIRKPKNVPAPIEKTAAQVEVVVRTGVGDIPNEVAGDLEPSAKVIGPHGWQHISVLDSRTTTICRARAWKKWDAKREPIGHSLPFREPPLHLNCRSRLVLIFLDDPEPVRQTFSRWVDQFSPAQQSAIFGARNVEAWRGGRMTDSELLRQANRPLEPQQLKKKTEAKSQGEFPFV